jgi:hypothetical protein
LGFDPDDVLTGYIARPISADNALFYRDLQSDLRATPGARSVAIASALPLRPSDQVSLSPADRPAPRAGGAPFFPLIVVDGDYFEALGTALFAGRPFNAQDTSSSSPVAVVSRRAADHLFSTAEVVGKHVLVDEKTTATIVGVVDDVVSTSTRDVGAVYLPYPQRSRADMIAIVRTTTAPAAWEGSLRAVVAGHDRGEAVFDVRTLAVVVDANLWL